MLTEIDPRNASQLKTWLESRTQDLNPEIFATVTSIISQVKRDGDKALKELTEQFDHVKLDTILLNKEDIERLAAKADPAFKAALQEAKTNIETFHQAQKQNSYILTRNNGIYLGQRVLPLDSVGIYVPGGRAQYPSSVLMNAIPAKVAGVKRIIMTTPPNKDGQIEPNIALAASLAGIDQIACIGGAQAIAALAHGTQTIQPVDKIVGPGNIFVAAAKQLVFGKVDIDMIAGPSEILVIADAGADPRYVAADLLSQAEHDPMASAILLTTSRTLLDNVNEQLKIQSEVLPKKAIIDQSLQTYGKSIVCGTIQQCVDIANQIAPEHLELMVSDPMNWLGSIKHAGSVFLGYWTCESIGDYYGGTNHVLPTSGTARFSSALGVDAFIKKSSFLHYSKEAIQQDADAIIRLAQAEHLDAHANAARIRKEKQ